MTRSRSGKDRLLGTRIREYEILEIMGQGGMGAVYRARHVYLDQERAIKVIHSQLSQDEGFVDRFIREARILSMLHHPNLVQLYEFGSLDEDTFFMVMELIRGESVLDLLKRLSKVPPKDAVQIVRQAALGLHNAHQKGIIHRDISPDNLMLVKNDSGEEVTKVLDFGIAKPLREEHQYTMTDMFVGKPEFCSPEQCGILQPGEVIDHRSDIYSLAITLYYMLAGRGPFKSTNPQGYFVKHYSEIPKAVSALLPPGTIPEALDRVILKALLKNREDRHATMQEFVAELDEVELPGQAASPAVAVPPEVREDTEILMRIFERGKTLYDQGQWNRAIEEWNKGLQLSPGHPQLQQWIDSARSRPGMEQPRRYAGAAEPSPKRTRVETQQQRPVPAAPPKARWPLWLAAGAGFAIAVAVAIWLMIPARTKSTPPPRLALNLVRFHALPWAYVKITPKDPGLLLPEMSQEKPTPCYFWLPQGEYTVHFDNRGVTQGLVRDLRVEAGQTNSMLVTMTDYDPQKAFHEALARIRSQIK